MENQNSKSNSNSASNTLCTVIRWAARISSIPVILVFVLMFFGEGFDPARVKPFEWFMLLFGPFGFVLGLILGWWKDGLGGAITILSFFVAMLIGDYNASGAGIMMVCAGPEFLFLLAWILSKATKVPNGITAQSTILPSGTEDLGIRQERISQGQCPKCGAQVKSTDQNCPSCQINLSFARENLDQW